LSARVTLGWALLDLGRLAEAREEFQTVRKSAPDNFAAIRGLAQLHVLDEGGHEGLPEEVAEAPAPEYQIPAAPLQFPVPAPAARVVSPVAESAPAIPEPVLTPKGQPVVMQLEKWLSRVEALRAAV
jgi:hypothetical protein